MALIDINDVSKIYGNEIALNHVDLKIEPGKIIGLLGPNGSGKTTLIKLINGLIPLTSGEIKVDNRPVGIESKKIISYLPERTYLDPNMSVIECMNFFKDFYEDFDLDRAYELVSKLDINLNKKLSTLSKGTKEKVQLILVMSRRAKVYILDEPIAGVDPAARDYILDIIMNNFNEGSTLIICTHLISDIEKILDEVVFLKKGRVMLQDTPDSVRANYSGSIHHALREVFRCF